MEVGDDGGHFEVHATQYPGARPQDSPIQLVMGIDFGTAYSKIVIGEQRRAYAVPIQDGGRGVNAYLFPGVINVAPHGQVQLGRRRGNRTVVDLKMRILQGDTDDALIGEVVAYLALLMRRARAWLMSAQKDIYQGHYLDWNVNVGLPTQHFQDEQLQAFYRQMVRAAWAVSANAGRVTLGSAEDCFADAGNLMAEDAIGLFPEFAAQISGYVRSPRRNSGPHVLIDVGAGTVDVAFFNVHVEDDEDLFPILSAIVDNYGVQARHRHRVEELSKASTKYTMRYSEADSYADEARVFGASVKTLKDVDFPFRQGVLGQVVAAFRCAKIKYPRIDALLEPVRFFLCGGGGRVDMYRSIAEAMVRDAAPCNLERLPMSQPDKLQAQNLVTGAYDRLSVAYGLSFDQDDIGIVRISSEIDDLAGENASQAGSVGAQCPVCRGNGGARGNNECRRCGGSGFLAGRVRR